MRMPDQLTKEFLNKLDFTSLLSDTAITPVLDFFSVPLTAEYDLSLARSGYRTEIGFAHALY